MTSAAALRAQIEASLANRIPSALSPAPRTIRPVAPTGIPAIDTLLDGGLPVGAITEAVGAECSGRTSFSMSFLAMQTQAAKTCAWIDISDTFDPESAAATGIDLNRLLWVRCQARPVKRRAPDPKKDFALPEKYMVAAATLKGLHGGGCGGPHPRGEVKGLSKAVGSFLNSDTPGRHKVQRAHISSQQEFGSKGSITPPADPIKRTKGFTNSRSGQWNAIARAMQVTDLLLQAGGFSAIVLDMGSIAPEFSSRVPLATWFRYRAAAERTQSSILLLTQYACAKSSAGLLLRFQATEPLQTEPTLLTSLEHRIEVSRERFATAHDNVIPIRKPPQSERSTLWKTHTAWSGSR
jgi:hypothetical protein